MKLGIIVPCYNEEAVLPETARRLTKVLDTLREKNKISENSKIYFIDDGSNDCTWTMIKELTKGQSFISGIKLSRNRGHQNALQAGLLTAEGDALISIDADLQDDTNVIEEMVDRYNQGFDIVYGVRSLRNKDTKFKKFSAEIFYKFMQFIGVNIVYNHADFRLMSRRSLEGLRHFKEVNLFLRGIIPLIGYKSTKIYYNRNERFAGETKYPLKKMIAFALDGITSFSTVPLRLISVLGFLVFIFTLIMSFWILYVKVARNEGVPGWASTVLPVYFIGGIQIFCVGIIGEYLGKIYQEVKGRPMFIIEEIT